MELADSHCHLDDAQFDADRSPTIERARQSGVSYMLTIGTGSGPPDLEAAVRLADQYEFVFATAGVHPNDAPKIEPATFESLHRVVSHPKVKAIGEIGLDYHWGTPKDIQMPAFIRQLEMAAAAQLPVVIHTRDAWDDTVGVLRAHWEPTGLPCVMHCFSGGPREAEQCIAMGFYLAFGGVATFPKAHDVRAAARLVPADRLLLETDSPYLAPVPHRGKRNEPAFVAHTARKIAEVRGIPLEELASQTTANFERLFRIQSDSVWKGERTS